MTEQEKIIIIDVRRSDEVFKKHFDTNFMKNFYNIPMKSGELARVISDCYQTLGRRSTIDLLDDMNRVGFSWSTKSGLSFATDDLITPSNKTRIITDAEKEVMKILKR